MRKLIISIVLALSMVLGAVAPASAEQQMTQQPSYVGPFDIPSEWRNDTTISTLLYNLYRPLALSNSSPNGHQDNFQYLAFYFCHPVFTPQQCFDNNDPIGNAVVMLGIKPMTATAFDSSTVEFSKKLVVWFPNTPQGSTSCTLMTDWGDLPFLALTRRGLTDLREQLAIDTQPLKTITTVDGSAWLQGTTQDSFTWRCQ